MDAQSAWLADFYEGEGCISAFDNGSGKNYGIDLSIAQKHTEALDRIKKILDEEDIRYEYYTNGNGNCMKIRITYLEGVLEFLNIIWPLLTEWRREQARVAVARRGPLPFW